MNSNLLPSDRMAVVGAIDPDAHSTGSYSTGWVAAKDFTNFMAVVQSGSLGASATLDAKLEQATDGTGTGAKDITGKSITQLTQAGSDSSKQAIVNCRSDEMDTNNDFSYIRLTLTTGTATSDASGLLFATDARYGPASDHDVASVAEIVS